MDSLVGKTCLVTGGTAGIGGAISKGLALIGARVVMVGRDPVKGRQAVEEIRAATANEEVSYLQADLLSQASIRAMAREFLATHRRLHVLVNNVGGVFWKRGLTEDGVERSLELNLVTPFLVTELLLPLLKDSAPARIVNVATRPRRTDTVHLDDLQSEHGYSGFAAYGRAKTGLITYTYELGRRLEGSGVTANCYHPGIVTETEFSRQLPVPLQLAGPLFARLTFQRVSLDEAADTAIWLAASPEVAHVTGTYFVKRHPAASLPQTYDPAFAKKLWDECAALSARGAS